VNAFKKNIKKLISQGDTEIALDQLVSQYIDSNGDVYNEVVIISANFNQIKSQNRIGVTEQGEFNRIVNQINNSILELIDKKIPYILSKQVNETNGNLLICRKHLIELIDITRYYIKQLNFISWMIIIVAFPIIIISLGKIFFDAPNETKNSIELIKIGFGLFLFAIPLWLQGLNYKRKNRIANLKTSISLLENAKRVDDEFLKKIAGKIIESIAENF